LEELSASKKVIPMKQIFYIFGAVGVCSWLRANL